MKKLSYEQLEHLKRLAKQKGPVTGGTLEKKGGFYRPSVEGLVAKGLVRIRKTAGRADRYEIRAAGRELLKAHVPLKKKYN